MYMYQQECYCTCISLHEKHAQLIYSRVVWTVNTLAKQCSLRAAVKCLIVSSVEFTKHTKQLFTFTCVLDLSTHNIYMDTCFVGGTVVQQQRSYNYVIFVFTEGLGDKDAVLQKFVTITKMQKCKKCKKICKYYWYILVA